MKQFYFLSLLLFLFSYLQSEAFAQNKPKTGSLSDMAFIEGHWKANDNGKIIEAVWSAPEGDNIVGFIRMMNEGKVTLYELFAFEQTEQGPIALVKHFKPGLVGLEEKDQADRYNFLEAGKDRAVFEKQGENLRVMYEKRPGEKFAIALGKQQEGEWVYDDLWEFNRIK